ncbi:hypothetical protein JCM6882_002450 [Rhodosporidiobolus microsporus]
MPAPSPSGSSSSAAGSSGVSRAPPPSNPSLPAEQCLTPPSVTRRENRLRYCQYVRAGAGRQGAGSGDGAEGTGEEEHRTGYAAEEVEARRVGRRAAEWAGWEAEAEAYAGPLVGMTEDGEGGSIVRQDGTVDWDSLPSLGNDVVDPFNAPDLALPAALANDAAAVDYTDFLRSIDDPAAALPPPRAGRFALPATTAAAGGDSSAYTLPPNALPLVLGALYVAARAMGVGRSHGRAAQNGVAEKVRRF